METSPTANFNRLYAEQYRVVYAFLLGHTGSRETASDLLQETFLRVWKHIGEVDAIPAERQRFWLLAIARNQIRDLQRRQSVRQRTETALRDQIERRELQVNPAQIVEAKAQKERLDAAICALPEALCVVLTLHIVGEMTSAEVGEVLNRPAGTIRYQLSQARGLLTKALQHEEVYDALPTK